MKGLRLRRRATAGFSLTEMLVTTLIMVMVTAMVAAGIPVAMETYTKTVNSANAQAALSTTLTALRAELDMATVVRTDNNTITYTPVGTSYTVKLSNYTNGSAYGVGLRKRYFKGNGEPDGEPLPLIPDRSVTDELRVEMIAPAYDPGNGVVTIESLTVTDKANRTLASVSDYKVQTRVV